MLSSLEALRSAYNPDVVPHESPKFIPVVRNDDFFVRIGYPAFVPFRELRDSNPGLHGDVIAGRFGKDDALQQRVAGESVRAVQPRA